jgi:hypothetical protein
MISGILDAQRTNAYRVGHCYDDLETMQRVVDPGKFIKQNGGPRDSMAATASAKHSAP